MPKVILEVLALAWKMAMDQAMEVAWEMEVMAMAMVAWKMRWEPLAMAMVAWEKNMAWTDAVRGNMSKVPQILT